MTKQISPLRGRIIGDMAFRTATERTEG